ncbi:MAG: SDR family oxidoreductase [Candidatus Protistobacter heckmanni]|nr:SDR family oxidoreductase [Candidatus Protistobacter heckmanni]
MAGVQYDFTDRHAVITGGAAGIGLVCAQRLVEDGASVSLWDRDEGALAQARAALGPKAQGIAVDVSDPASVERALQQTLDFSGRVDMLVNSAGITGPNVTLIDYPVEEWDRVFAINLRGTFLTCRAIAPLMKAAAQGKGAGRIVNIASVAGKEGNPNASVYSASKAAVIGLTKSLGKELSQTGVKVNCITPAAVKTGMLAQMTQQHIDYMLSKIPMNRFGEVDEIASLVAWLCSDDCSFSTGAVFDISGGRATY